MNIDVSYYSVSGLKNRRCAFLANRFDAEYGYKPGDAESWIVVNDYTPEAQGETRFTNGTLAWYTGLWSSPQGTAYITRHDGWVIFNPDIFAKNAFSRWQNHELKDFNAWGVHGAGEEVFVWGSDTSEDADAALAPSTVLRQENGDWLPIASPGFRIVAMHGTDGTNLWAAGAGGEIASWDGNSWVRHASIGYALHSIHVGEKNVYATSARGEILRVSPSGCELEGVLPGASMPGDAACVAVWNDDLWVGSARLGLFRKTGAGFTCVKPNITCTSIDARDELVLCAPNRISGSANGTDFMSFGVDVVRNGRSSHGLCRDLEGNQQ
ncbi:MAG: hypothetical protein KDB82_01740 [Planctomycetes bacterium]|nr:hypothetical protein [Planctomycetota bacterium]